MSVFLTPDLKPFVGGTYFPPNDSHGRPGFKTILNAIHEQVRRVPPTSLTNVICSLSQSIVDK